MSAVYVCSCVLFAWTRAIILLRPEFQSCPWEFWINRKSPVTQRPHLNRALFPHGVMHGDTYEAIHDWILQGKSHAAGACGCQERSQNTSLANTKSQLYFGWVFFSYLDHHAILFHWYRSNVEARRCPHESPAPFAMQSEGLGTTLCKHGWYAGKRFR